MASVKHYSADGATQALSQDFGTLVSDVVEVDSARRKYAVENVADRILGASPFTGLILTIEPVGTNDGWTMYFTATDPNGTLSKPWGPTDDAPDVTVGGVYGAWGSTGTKGCVVTAINATGETTPSGERSFVIGATDQIATVDWEQVPGATSYRVYFTNTPGDYSSSTVVVVPGSTTTVDLDGTGSVGSPPSTNTTGGAGPDYGTPPAFNMFTQLDKNVGALAIGRQWFYYACLKVPAGTSSVGNRRAVRIRLKETL